MCITSENYLELKPLMMRGFQYVTHLPEIKLIATFVRHFHLLSQSMREPAIYKTIFFGNLGTKVHNLSDV